MNHLCLHRIATAIFIMTIAACTSTPKTNQDIFNEITRATEVSYESDAEKALSQAEATLRQAQLESLDFFAPAAFANIEREVRNARQANVEGKTARIQNANQTAASQLQQGLRTKKTVQEQLAQPLRHKKTLDHIKAAHVSRIQYRIIMQNLLQFVERVEREDTISAGEISALLEQMKALEIETVLTVHWQPAAQVLAQAKTENADQLAPKTYTHAASTVSAAEAQIRTQYQAIDVVTQIGQDALRAAQQALFVAREARLLVNATPSSAEAFVLRMQTYFFDIAQTLDGLDVRHLSLQDQALAIQQRLKERLQTSP